MSDDVWRLSLQEISHELNAIGVDSRVYGDGATIVTDIVNDSRQVSSGSLFVAVPGTKSDGRSYLKDAVLAGAVAAVIPVSDAVTNEGIGPSSGLMVPNVRQALGYLASIRFGHPSRALTVGAVTGTNGKSTVAWITHSLLLACRVRSLLIGTIGIFDGDQKLAEAPLTTPDALTVHRLIADHKQRGGTHVVMEASSHALDQHRLDGVAFDSVAWTNLTRDHADYHRTMEDYFAAKVKLFSVCAKGGKSSPVGIVMADAPWGDRMLVASTKLLPTVAITANDGTFDKCVETYRYQRVVGGELESIRWCSDLACDWCTTQSPFVGAYNAQNLMQGVVLATALGAQRNELVNTTRHLPQVPGRMERFSGDGVTAIVDYAHTPDALERVLEACRERTRGKLWVVFGCGGDRDAGKRPLMGRAAHRLADEVVVTSDNPRTEPPSSIIDEIVQGIPSPVVVEADRARAIAYAISRAKAGDVVVVAGKGHEDYQILGEEKRHFSDQNEVRVALEERVRRSPHD